MPTMQTLEPTTPLPHANHLFGTRNNAGDNIGDSIRMLVESIGPVAYMRQVHSSKLTYAPGPGIYEETDALYTDRPGLWLAVSTADCLPVLISSPRVVAAVHAGWRGLHGGILENTVETLLREYNLDPASLFVTIGPCIRQNDYEVEDTFKDYFDEKFFAPSGHSGHALLNLPGVAKQLLRNEGIPSDNIFDSGHDTFREKNLFFSYRRSKKLAEPHNVQPSLICLPM